MLTLWSPWNDLEPVTRHFDRLLRWPTEAREASFVPAVDVEESEGHYLIRADLPGHDESNISVEVRDGTLVLSGKRELLKTDERDSSLYRERSFGSFRRTFRLGSLVDPEKIEASYDKGVLTVTVPKREQAKPRQIPISGN